MKAMYTMDAAHTEAITNYIEVSQNRCDICGIASTEKIYEFRCYRRMRRDPVSLEV